MLVDTGVKELTEIEKNLYDYHKNLVDENSKDTISDIDLLSLRYLLSELVKEPTIIINTKYDNSKYSKLKTVFDTYDNCICEQYRHLFQYENQVTLKICRDLLYSNEELVKYLLDIIAENQVLEEHSQTESIEGTNTVDLFDSITTIEQVNINDVETEIGLDVYDESLEIEEDDYEIETEIGCTDLETTDIEEDTFELETTDIEEDTFELETEIEETESEENIEIEEDYDIEIEDDNYEFKDSNTDLDVELEDTLIFDSQLESNKQDNLISLELDTVDDETEEDDFLDILQGAKEKINKNEEKSEFEIDDLDFENNPNEIKESTSFEIDNNNINEEGVDEDEDLGFEEETTQDNSKQTNKDSPIQFFEEEQTVDENEFDIVQTTMSKNKVGSFSSEKSDLGETLHSMGTIKKEDNTTFVDTLTKKVESQQVRAPVNEILPLRTYLKKHPYTSIEVILQMYDKKEVEENIKKGRIIKKNGTLRAL